MGGLGATARSLLGRRAFLATAATGAGALVARGAMLPRPLTEAEIEALVAAESAAQPARAVAAPTTAPGGAAAPAAAAITTAGAGAVDLSGSMAQIPVNRLAEELEWGPRVINYRRSFKINTVEIEPQRDLTSRTDWAITVDGLVEKPLVLTPATLERLPHFRQVKNFHCVEGWGVRDVLWEGVQLSTLLELAEPAPQARFVTFHTLGGIYTDSLTMEQALEPEAMIATRLNEQPLPDRQGYPNRLVVPYFYGYKSVKWVSRITLEPKRHIGFWERRGWQLDPYV